MTKTIRSMILLIAYLVALSTALPSTSREPPQSNEPRTLLGKPYRRIWRSSQPNTPPPPRWTFSSLDSDPNTTSFDPESIGSESQNAYAFHQPPLVLNTSPESRGFGISLDLVGLGTERLRLGLGRPKGRLRYTTSSEEALLFDQNIIIPLASAPSGDCRMSDSEQPAPEAESRKLSAPKQRSTGRERLYDRGEWKSRLSGDY